MGRTATVMREDILKAAAQAFHENGYHRTSFEQIAERLGVAKGSVAFPFKTKENLLVEVIGHNLQDALDKVFAKSFTSDRSPLDQLKAFLWNICEYQKRHLDDLGCFFGRMSLEVSDVSEVVRLKLRQAFDQYLGYLKVAIIQAKEAGEIHKDVDVDDLAWFILAQMEGAMVLVKTYRDVGEMERSFMRLVTMLKLLGPAGVAAMRAQNNIDSLEEVGS